MSKVFKPIVFCRVPASLPHDQTAKYYVAIGVENWENDGKNLVIKIQMEYDGKRQGRKAPSYPIMRTNIYSKDWDNICKAVEKVKNAYLNGFMDGEIAFEN